MRKESSQDRRRILKRIALAGAGLCVAGAEARLGAEEKGEDVSPAEDLMREHGVLNRVLLVYDEFLRRISGPRPDLAAEMVAGAASIKHLGIYDLANFTPVV